MNDKEKFDKVKNYMRRQLESKGLYVESGEHNLSVSLTQFGLSTVYADISADEIQYCLESLDDDELNEILGEK